MDDIFYEGYVASINFQTENPYKDNDPRKIWWDRGVRRAQAEVEQLKAS